VSNAKSTKDINTEAKIWNANQENSNQAKTTQRYKLSRKKKKTEKKQKKNRHPTTIKIQGYPTP